MTQASDTPRTEDMHYECASEPDDVHRYMKMRDFARQLERELAAAKTAKRPWSDKLAGEVIDGQVKEIDRLTALVQAMRQELAAAKADLQWLSDHHANELAAAKQQDARAVALEEAARIAESDVGRELWQVVSAIRAAKEKK